ncbi:hypothetical protein GCM10025794_36020 [Massilia kyonggiensis]
MCHEYSALEIRLAEDVGKSGRVIDVKAKIREQLISKLSKID